MTLWTWFADLRRWLAAQLRPVPRPPQSLGERGEAAARRYIKQLGWKVIEANTQTRFSELDLIAVEGRTIVFIEVKTRTSDDPEAPLVAVGSVKQQRIVRAALAYLKKHHLLEQAVRFDVIGVSWSDDSPPAIRHIRDAFSSTQRGQFFS